MACKAPFFWTIRKKNDSASLVFLARFCTLLLAPLGLVTRILAMWKQHKTSPKCPIPVFCCGNVTTGGTGKTPLAADLAQRLQKMGKNPHILTRGYGGSLPSGGNHILRIMPSQHKAGEVGDEALLLSYIAPTWRGKNRYLAAHLALRSGADCLIMDDGLQNTHIHKDCVFLTIDGPAGLGNGHLLPAGPLREPWPPARRIDALCLIGPDEHIMAAELSLSCPIISACLETVTDITPLENHQLLAFAGIGRPEKFFSTLRALNLSLLEEISFADHHTYTEKELTHLLKHAETKNAMLVTTRKDAIKIPEKFLNKIFVIDIKLRYKSEDLLNNIIKNTLNNFHYP